MNNLKNYFYNLNQYKSNIVFSLLAFIFVWIINLFLGIYKDDIQSVSSNPDIILDNFHTLPFGQLFSVSIYIIIFLILFYTFLFKIKIFDYVLFQFSFLSLIRNFFIFISPLNVRFDAAEVHFFNFLNNWNFNNDLFFSGHVAFPFLAFLIFKKNNKNLSYIFLLFFFFEIFIVLATKRHYSIDVFAAPFITYTCYVFFDRFYNKYLSLKIK